MFKKIKNEEIYMINPNCILGNPHQPRKSIDEEKLKELIQSIKKNGIIQPITVRYCQKGKYELVCGNRRLLASKYLNLEKVPCIIKNISDKDSFAFSLIENLQRDNLNFIEEAIAIDSLIKKYGYTQTKVAEKLGISQSAVANKLRILKLNEKQIEKIIKFSLTQRHARALLKLEDDETRDDILNEIIIKRLNVEQTEKMINAITEPKQKSEKAKLIVKDVRLFVNSINKAIKVMKNSGIPAKSEKEEDDNFIKYTVIIPK